MSLMLSCRTRDNDDGIEDTSSRKVQHNYHDYSYEVDPAEASVGSTGFAAYGSGLLLPMPAPSTVPAMMSLSTPEQQHETSYYEVQGTKQVVRRPTNQPAPSFPVRLHYVLEQLERDGLSHIASWQPHGRCFLVHDKELFVKTVLPCWFSQSSYASFTRQVNMYGFKRLTNGPDKGGYYHEKFLRGSKMRFLAYEIPRTKIKGCRFRLKSSPDSEPNFYKMIYVPHNRKPQWKTVTPPLGLSLNGEVPSAITPSSLSLSCCDGRQALSPSNLAMCLPNVPVLPLVRPETPPPRPNYQVPKAPQSLTPSYQVPKITLSSSIKQKAYDAVDSGNNRLLRVANATTGIPSNETSVLLPGSNRYGQQKSYGASSHGSRPFTALSALRFGCPPAGTAAPSSLSRPLLNVQAEDDSLESELMASLSALLEPVVEDDHEPVRTQCNFNRTRMPNHPSFPSGADQVEPLHLNL